MGEEKEMRMRGVADGKKFVDVRGKKRGGKVSIGV